MNRYRTPPRARELGLDPAPLLALRLVLVVGAIVLLAVIALR